MNYLINVCKALAIVMLVSVSVNIFGQTTTITGKVFDSDNNEGLFSANVVLQGTTIGTTTDFDGNFSLIVPDTGNSLTLLVSYVGYQDKLIELSKPYGPVDVSLDLTIISGQEVVVTASRVNESIVESAASIEKMTASQIRRASSGDFYQDLGNFKDVDMITSSYGFKVFNTRGFNTTAPVRTVQFVDGMDNQAPGLNFPVGNLVGANDLDLHSVEVISGASSALYGANAFQGVLSMTTKNPFDYQGLAVSVKGGSRDLLDVQARYARVFGKKENFAVKVTGQYLQIKDWEATDPEANVYGDIDADVNFSEVIRDLPNDEDLTQEERDDFIALNNYLDFNQNAFPGIKNIQAPGYTEVQLADYDTRSIKASAQAIYRFDNKMELSYDYKMGLGTAVYQGTSRYSINNIGFQQHKLELKGSNFFVKAYTTIEDAGDSYDMRFSAINLSKSGISEWVGTYLGEYFGVLDTLTNGFDGDARDWMVDSANARATALANATAFDVYAPGTAAFDSVFNTVINDPDLETGAKFLDKSSLQHIEAQYNFDWFEPVDIIAGASFRRYGPKSFGTIFRDTLIDPADTLENGLNDPDAEYDNISNVEFGAYVQATKRFFADRLKLIGSIRVDKNQNYDVQFSPRFSAVISQNNHTFRFSAQTAFRSPTLQNQFILLDLGPITLKGNLDGFDNLYTLESVDTFRATYDSTFQIRPELLEAVTLDPIQPEQVTTLEVGYRLIHNKVLYLDIAAYYNWYTDFIGDVRVVEPDAGQAGEESGEDAVLTESFTVLQIATNANETVRTYGFSVGMSYYFGKGVTYKANYTYSDINTDDVTNDVIPGFNTPKHKFNMGLEGKRLWKGLGFNSNLKFSDGFFWESPFGDGQVKPYYTLDAQLNYEFREYYTTIAVGASNLTDNRFQQAYGSPMVGRIFYASLLFDINKW